jgi:hypothetical protein
MAVNADDSILPVESSNATRFAGPGCSSLEGLLQENGKSIYAFRFCSLCDSSLTLIFATGPFKWSIPFVDRSHVITDDTVHLAGPRELLRPFRISGRGPTS